MKNYYTILLVLLGYCLHAQVPRQTVTLPTCASDELHRQQLLQNPSQHLFDQQMEQDISQWLLAPNVNRSVSTTYVIPVVVHIIHNNGPENIPNSQVFAGIQDMNDAFANSGPYLSANGVNTTIQFCLAQQDENGNFTNGINRVVSPLTNMTAETDALTLKNLIRWDPTKYLNIWIVNEITSLSAGPAVAGFSTLPASHGLPEDGIVNEARYFGTNTDDSKVVVHEAGHYLGLYHTFEGGCVNNDCLTDGDRVCDTPPDQSTAAVNCGNSVNTCTSDIDDLSVNNPFRPVSAGGLGDQPDQVENYMDYGYQACQDRFTDGQKNRMIAALSTTRASLLQSIGCHPLCTNPITIGFTMSASTITAGGTVSCTNTTSSAMNYQWYVNNQLYASTTNMSYMFSTPGYYTITLVATNNDSTCDQSMSQLVVVECGAQASFSVSPAAPYAIGATLNFTNTSANATGYQWLLDGVFQSTTNNFSSTFNTAGGHYIYLVATNGQCSDTSASVFFRIGGCDHSATTDNWFMPSTAMHFSGTNPPTVDSCNVLHAEDGNECTSSVSDLNGNLLFYTEGLHVWNRNHQQMPNGSGLLSHVSTNTGCIITPDPGNASRYYIFTADAWENNFANGLQYSIVDMTLDNGLGDVISTSKNIPVMTYVAERVSAVYHSNGRDVWVVVSSVTGNTLYSYLLTAAGLSSTPVITQIGSNMDIGSGLGGMKFSHDGNRLALCVSRNWQPSCLRIGDFDRSTGVLANVFDLMLNTQEYPYDVEFSPDNSRLYSSIQTTPAVLQYDLAAGGPSAISASRVKIDPFTVSWTGFGHLLLGNDGKIYISRTSTHIDCIPNPDVAGLSCGYTSDPVQVVFAINWCLPNFIRGLQYASGPYITGPDTICTGMTQLFQLHDATPSDSVTWHNTGLATLSNTSATSCQLTTTAPGTDTLSVIHYGSCGITFDTLIVHTFTGPVISLGSDTVLCSAMLLSPGSGFQSYLWQNGSTANSFLASTAGTYWVSITASNGCKVRDTIQLSAPVSLLPLNLGADTTVCLGHIVNLQPGASYPHYNWQDGSHNPVFTAYQPGLYWLSVSNGCQTLTDSIHVYSDESAIPLDLGPDTAICPGGFPLQLSSPAGYAYVWQDGSANTNFTVNAPGVFWVTVTDVNGCSARDTIAISACTGLQNFSATPVSIYPNPAADELLIDFGTMMDATMEIDLFDPLGRSVLQEHVIDHPAQVRLNTAALADGMYILQLHNGSVFFRQPIIIRHN